MRSRRDILGIVGAVVGVAVIVAACFGLRAIGGDRTDGAVSRAAWSALAAPAADAADLPWECARPYGSPTFDLRVSNRVPVALVITSVTDVDDYDWVSYREGTPCPGSHGPESAAAYLWGLSGLRLTPLAAPTVRLLQPGNLSGSPFTIEVSTDAGVPVGKAKLDLRSPTLGLTQAVVFRGNSAFQGVETRTLGAVVVDGLPKPVFIRVGDGQIIFTLD